MEKGIATMFHQDLSKMVDRILSNEAPNFDLVIKLINRGATFNPQRVLELFYRTEITNGSAYYPDHYLEWIDLLINANAQDTQHPVHKNTILMWATDRRESELVEKLLQAQTNPNLTNDKGETALHIAVRNNHPACVNLLLAATNSEEKIAVKPK